MNYDWLWASFWAICVVINDAESPHRQTIASRQIKFTCQLVIPIQTFIPLCMHNDSDSELELKYSSALKCSSILAALITQQSIRLKSGSRHEAKGKQSVNSINLSCSFMIPTFPSFSAAESGTLGDVSHVIGAFSHKCGSESLFNVAVGSVFRFRLLHWKIISLFLLLRLLPLVFFPFVPTSGGESDVSAAQHPVMVICTIYQPSSVFPSLREINEGSC